jgi:hypothetical protein
MSSTINATTVGVGGVVTTADNSGILVLQTASTTALTISAAQGVTLAGTLGVTGATTLSSTLAVTGITTVAAGSAAAPSIVSTTGTADTGQFFPAADTVAFSTAGTERIRITSGGLFGIGCTPARQLSVQYPFAKTDTSNRATAVFKSNDATNANEMLISSTGAATQASRVWNIQTGEDGVSNAGIIALQASGGSVTVGGSITVTAAAVLGYDTGSGGTVTQATSKSTAVTLNKPTGQITMNNAALGANSVVQFSCSNSLCADKDTVVTSLTSVGGVASLNNYQINSYVQNGSIVFGIRNTSAGSLSEAVVFNFAIIKGATA